MPEHDRKILQIALQGLSREYESLKALWATFREKTYDDLKLATAEFYFENLINSKKEKDDQAHLTKTTEEIIRMVDDFSKKNLQVKKTYTKKPFNTKKKIFGSLNLETPPKAPKQQKESKDLKPPPKATIPSVSSPSSSSKAKEEDWDEISVMDEGTVNAVFTTFLEPQDDNQWIIDSGSSVHIIESQGQGTVQLQVHDHDNAVKTIQVNDCLYIPNFVANLLLSKRETSTYFWRHKNATQSSLIPRSGTGVLATQENRYK